MRNRLCFYGCPAENGCRLYMFPNAEHDQERREEWLQVVGLDSDDSRRGLFLCEKHFSHRPFKCKLPFDAVPDVNLFHQRGSSKLPHATETQSTNTPSTTSATTLPLKLLAPVQTTKKSFIYVLEPINSDNNAQSAPTRTPLTRTCPVTASARGTEFYDLSKTNIAAAIKSNAPISKNDPLATNFTSSVLAKSLALKRSSPLPTSNSNAMPPAPKKLFSVLRPTFAAVQSMMPSNTTESSNNQLNSKNDLPVNSSVEMMPAGNSGAKSLVTITNSKMTYLNNSQKLHEVTINLNSCQKTTLSNSVQTQPKTFIIVRPPAKEASTTEALKKIAVPFTRSTANSAISMPTIINATTLSRLNSNTSAGSNVPISAAPRSGFSVLGTPPSTAIGCNSVKTILIPKKADWKPQKFIVKRHELKQLAVAPANPLNKVLNTSASISTAHTKPAALEMTPGNFAIVSTASISKPTIKAAVFNPTTHNNAINISLQPHPVTKGKSGYPSFVASSPTVQSTSDLSDSLFTPSRFNPVVFAKNENTQKPYNTVTTNHPISYAAASFFMPESNSYRVRAPSIEAAVDPLSIDARISSLARAILEKRQAMNISSFPCNQSSSETATNENSTRSIIDIVKRSLEASNVEASNGNFTMSSKASLLELQKQILCLKQKLESKETEVAELRSTMLNIAGK